MRRIAILLLAVALTSTVVAAQGPSKQAELQAKGITNWTPGMNRGQAAYHGVGTRFAGGPAAQIQGVTGTLQYDSGTLTALPILFGQVYGNQFNVNNNGNPLGGTLTASSFHFYFMEDSTADTGLFFQPATFVGASTINALASIDITGLANSGPSFSAPVLNDIQWTALGVANTFGSANGVFLGGWCLNSALTFPVTNETLGLDVTPGNAGNKGYTATSGVGNVAYAAQSFNAILRLTATAPNIPVELMSFGVQ
jgi:hypothetical protein